MTIDWDLEPPLDVPISAIEHFSYCHRQCALIHVEQTYDENLFTIRGRLAHERVESGEETAIERVRVYRDVPLWSERHGLRGKADVVEMRSDGPYPIEYKVGRPHGPHADLQLCAQALCLEEMVGLPVPVGAVYHHAIRRRREVSFTEELRRRTIEVASAIRSMLADQRVPAAPNDSRCPRCSLLNACMPTVVGDVDRLRGLQGSLFRPLEVGRDP
jgi:CRISPR-associated exonuclease Cas4